MRLLAIKISSQTMIRKMVYSTRKVKRVPKKSPGGENGELERAKDIIEIKPKEANLIK